MKRLLYLIIAAMLSLSAMAADYDLGTVQTKKWIGFGPIWGLDTLGRQIRPDTLELYVFYGRLANATAYNTRVGLDFVAASWIDSMKLSSSADPVFMYHDSVGRIDADSGNGDYWGFIRAIKTQGSVRTLWEHTFSFSIADSSDEKAVNFAAKDSVPIDYSDLAGATGAISATTIAADAIGSSELATDAIGAAEVAADAIGASELATDAITATEIAADAIAASEIAANAIGASEVATGAIIMGTEIDTTGLATSVWAHGTKILTALDEDNTVMDLNATTIGTAINVTTLNGIAADVITASSIATDAIGAAEIAAGAITSAEATSVGTATAVTTVNGLAADVITAAAIAADAIGASELATGAIAAAEVATGAIVFGVEFDTTGSGFGAMKRAGDTLLVHAPHANNWGGTAAGSGSVTPDTIRDIIGDSLATFLTPRQLRDTIWTATGARILTELDEDNTTIDINGTTIGTATNVTTLNGIAANVITATSIATDAITAAKIAADAITNSELAADAIGASELATDAIGAAEIAAGAITSTEATSVAAVTGAVGSVTAKVTLVDSSANDIAMMGNYHPLDSTYQKEMHDSLDTQAWAAPGSGGGSGGVSYPFLERITTIDAPGTLTRYQFVIDTTALGGSNEYAMINKAITIRDTSANAGKTIVPAIIERVNCVAANCTLQVADSLPFAPAAGDSIWIWGNEPAYVIATMSEAAGVNTDTLLARDTTGNSSAGSVGGAIASGGTGGSVDFDSTQFLKVMQDHGWYAALDSLVLRVTRGNSFSLPLAGDLFSQAQFEAFSLNIGKIKGSSTLVVDSARNAGSLTQADIDSIVAGVIAGTAAANGTGIFAVTLYARDTINGNFVSGINLTAVSGVTNLFATTGVNGYATFNVDAATWTFNALGSPYTWVPFSRTVAGSITDTITGGGVTIIPATSPDLATIYGQVNRNGTAVAGLAVSIVLTRPDTLSIDSMFVDFNHTVYTDANGVWQDDVYFLAGSTRNFYYTVTFTVAGQKRTLYCRPTAQGGPYLINDILVEKP